VPVQKSRHNRALPTTIVSQALESRRLKLLPSRYHRLSPLAILDGSHDLPLSSDLRFLKVAFMVMLKVNFSASQPREEEQTYVGMNRMRRGT